MSDGLCNKLLELKKIEKSETINVSFGVKSNVFCSFCLLFLSLVFLFHLHIKALQAAPRFMNSGRLSGRQRRMMGKWVFWWFTLRLPLDVTPLSSQTMLWFERKMPRGSLGGGFNGCCEVSAGVVVLHLTTPWGWACECVTMEIGRVTDTSRSRLPSCLLFPLPPLSSHHTETPGTHMLPLCHSRTCQQLCVFCDAEGSILCVCSRIKPLLVARRKH